jgi:hypothetical protein
LDPFAILGGEYLSDDQGNAHEYNTKIRRKNLERCEAPPVRWWRARLYVVALQIMEVRNHLRMECVIVCFWHYTA